MLKEISTELFKDKNHMAVILGIMEGVESKTWMEL